MQSPDIQEKPDLPNKAFIFPSLSILLCLILQGGATLNLWCFPESLSFLPRFELACDPTLYPFTEYPMFNGTHQLGSKFTQHLLFATLEDSTEVYVGPSDFRTTLHLFFDQVIGPLKSGKKQLIYQVFEDYQFATQKQVKSFRLEKHSITLINNGYRLEPVQVITFDASSYRQSKN